LVVMWASCSEDFLRESLYEYSDVLSTAATAFQVSLRFKKYRSFRVAFLASRDLDCCSADEVDMYY
jgi:hypothetical protein